MPEHVSISWNMFQFEICVKYARYVLISIMQEYVQNTLGTLENQDLLDTLRYDRIH